MHLLWKETLCRSTGRALYRKIRFPISWEIHRLSDIPCRAKNRKTIFYPFMLMKKVNHIRQPGKLIMLLVGILKQHSLCRERLFGQHLYQLIPLRRENRWQVSGNRYMTVLVFILILLIVLLYGTAKQALRLTCTV